MNKMQRKFSNGQQRMSRVVTRERLCLKTWSPLPQNKARIGVLDLDWCLAQDFAVNSHNNASYGDLTTGAAGGVNHMSQESVAAGHLHDQHADRFEICLVNQGGDLFLIHFLARIQLWTGDRKRPAFQKILVKVSKGKGNAIRGDQQI